MDSENFVIKRHRIMERLAERRAKELTSYPFRMAEDYGMNLPSWARLALTFASKGGVLSRVLEIGLPLAVPFLMKKKTFSLGRLVQQFFLPRS